MSAHAPSPRLALPVFVALLVLLAWAPLPLGSNRPWSASVLWGGVLALAALLALSNLDRAAAVFERLRPARWPLALFGVWAAIGVAQVVPLPSSLVALLSPSAAEHWSAVGRDGAWTLSVDPGTSQIDAIESLALLALLAVTVLTLTTWRRLTVVAVFVLVMGVAEALLGISVQMATGHGLFASGPQEGVGGIAGTFVNPNHFAGFLEPAIAIALGLMLLGPRLSAPDSLRGAVSELTDQLLSPRSLLLLLVVLLLAALLWSGSRGALLAVACAATFVAILVASGRGLRALPVLLALPLALGLSLVWLGPGTLERKIDAQGFDGNRLHIFAASLDAAAAYPLVGAGAGAYRFVFPAYKDERLDLRFYEHAHNDFIEELVERGVVGAAAFVLAIGVGLAQMSMALRRRHSRLPRAILVGSLTGTGALTVHALYDFNFQIPANAAFFVLLLGLGLVASQLAREPRARMEG